MMARECETCKGSGTIVGDFGNPYADEEGTCPTCGGAGEVEMSTHVAPTWLAVLDADELTALACNCDESAIRRTAAARELA